MATKFLIASPLLFIFSCILSTAAADSHVLIHLSSLIISRISSNNGGFQWKNAFKND